MELGLTFPLQRFLKLRFVPYGDPEADLFYCWDLHCITLLGRPSLLAVHCHSRHTAVAFDVSPAQWADLPAFGSGLICQSLTAAGLPPAEVEAYMSRAGAPLFTRTHGRRPVAFLNRAWDDVLALDMAVDPASCHQPFLEQQVNRCRCHCAGYEGWGKAEDFLKRAWAEHLPF
ncbi:MAG: hypothetical protein IIV90_07560 [Oscillospiraceae bacterium]|nr:hypothetical protein [Oscillospiraceae bacterium]